MAKKKYTAPKPVEENAVEQVEAVEPEVVQDEIEEIEAAVAVKPMVLGVVEGCAKLNVRKNPAADAEVVCVIDRNTKVVIDENESTDEFYKICTVSGIDGFCVKRFVTIQ